MCVEYTLGAERQNMIPVTPQRCILLIRFKIFERFKIPDKAVTVIQNKRNTVFRMAWSVNDSAMNAHAKNNNRLNIFIFDLLYKLLL